MLLQLLALLLEDLSRCPLVSGWHWHHCPGGASSYPFCCGSEGKGCLCVFIVGLVERSVNSLLWFLHKTPIRTTVLSSGSQSALLCSDELSLCWVLVVSHLLSTVDMAQWRWSL